MFVFTKTIFLEEEFYFNFDWPQIFHAYSCKPKDFTDMLPRIEWKCNGMKTRGFRRWSRSDTTRPWWFAGRDIFNICGQAVPRFVKNIKISSSFTKLYNQQIVHTQCCVCIIAAIILSRYRWLWSHYHALNFISLCLPVITARSVFQKIPELKVTKSKQVWFISSLEQITYALVGGLLEILKLTVKI
jgi:hypothetical protein